MGRMSGAMMSGRSMGFPEMAGPGQFWALSGQVGMTDMPPLEIAFVADTPGKWLIHCHMLGHAASGMTTWINVR